MIAGVAAGLADYLGIYVTLIRIIFIIFALFGIAEFVYIIMWIAVPEKSFFQEYQNFNADYKAKESSFNADYKEKEAAFETHRVPDPSSRTSKVTGRANGFAGAAK